MQNNSPTQMGRRDNQRLKLRMPASFLSLDGEVPALLLDLSLVGARVAIHGPPNFSKGFLYWMDFEVYGDVVWTRDTMFGLRFDHRLAVRDLLKTRDAAPLHQHRPDTDALEAARAWAQGK